MPTHSIDQLKIFEEGAVELITAKELQAKLAQKRSLRIKYGADPSTADLHLGHTVPLRKLKRFQELGHHIIFLVGDFTARVGDPSGQSETRRTLSEREVRENAKTYEKQVFRILDRKKTEVRYNSEWFSKFRADDFLNLASRYTVARILERDDFAKRYREKKPITILEFLYPLLQGYDSVVLKADVEIGGTDQKFNLLVGRELQRDWRQSPQVVLTLPLIEGTDGKDKMSKSLGNHIAIQDTPENMFGKLMSIPDALTIRYYRYLTDQPEASVKQIESELASGSLHPREAKARLAREIVGMFHGVRKAEEAEAAFDRLFRAKELPEAIPDVTLAAKQLSDGKIDLITLLKEAGLTSSKSEARRLIEQGGVKVNETRVSDPEATVSLEEPVIIQCGKRKFARIKVKS